MPSFGREIYAIRIAGVGDATLSEGRWLLCTSRLTSDPDALCKPLQLSYPAEIKLETTLRDGIPKGGNLTFLIGGSTSSLLPVAQQIATYGRPQIYGVVTEEVGPADTTLTTSFSGAGGATVFLGREAVVLGSEGASGVYSSCVRARLGTTAQVHPVLSPAYVTNPVTAGREVELLVFGSRDGYADGTVLYQGVVQGTKRFAKTISITTRSGLDVIQTGVLLRERWRGKIFAGRFAQGALGGYSLDGDLPLAVDPAGLVTTEAVLCTGEGEVFVAEFNAEGGFDFVRGLNDAARRGRDILPGEDVDVYEMFTTAEQSVEVYCPSTDTSQAWSQNPIRLVEQILTTTESGANGPRDLGRRELGLGISRNLLDTDTFDAYTQRYANTRLESLDIGFGGDPVEAAKLIFRALAPLHLGLTVGAKGIRPWGMLDVVPYEGLPEITKKHHVVAPGDLDMNDDTAVDRVSFFYGAYLGGPKLRANVSVSEVSRLYPYSVQESLEVDASGYGINTESQWAARLTEAYQFAPPVLPVRVPWSTHDLWPGDAVIYSHPDVGARDGSIGVDRITALVVGRKHRRGQGDGKSRNHHTLDLTLALVGGNVAKSGSIANSARVVSYTAPGSSASGQHEIVVSKHWFKTDGSAPLSPDVSPWVGGDLIKITDDELVPTTLGVPIESIEVDTSATTSTIIINKTHTLSSAPSEGDIIRHAAHGVASDSVRAAFAFWAPDSGDFLSGAQPYQYNLEAYARAGEAENYQEWTRFGDGAMTSEDPVDEAVLERLSGNIRNTLKRRLPATTATFDARRPVRLHGSPSALMLLDCWYVDRTDTQVVWGVLASGKDAATTLRVVKIEASAQFVISDEVSIPAGGEGVYELICDVTDYSGVIWVGIVATSDTTTTGEVTIKDDDVQALILQGRAAHWEVPGAGPFTTYPSDRVYRIDWSAPTSGVLESQFPTSRTVIDLINPSGGNYYAFVWPVWSSQLGVTYTDTGSDALETFQATLTTIGHVEVYALSKATTATRVSGPPPRDCRAGMETAVRTLGRLQADMEWAQRNRVSVLGAGPSVSGDSFVEGNRDYPLSLPAGTQTHNPNNKIYNEFAQDTIWACWAGLGTWASLEDTQGNVEYKSIIVVEGLLGAYAYGGEDDVLRVRLEVVMDDSDGAGVEIASAPLTIEVPVRANRHAERPLSNLPWLRVFSNSTEVFDNKTLAQHNARSLWPATAAGRDTTLDDLGLVSFRIEMEDTTPLVAPSAARLLQVRVIPVGDWSEYKDHMTYLHCPCAAAYIKPEPLT